MSDLEMILLGYVIYLAIGIVALVVIMSGD